MHIKYLFRKLEGIKPFRRHRHRGYANITLDLKKVGWEILNWIHLARGRLHGVN
jgi:hypothetical protein